MHILYCQLSTTSMRKSCHPQQHGALHILYNQRRYIHKLVSIYAVVPQQIIQQLEQRPMQEDQKIFRTILRSTTKLTTK